MNRIHRGKRQRPKRQGGPKRKPGKKNSGGRRSRRQTKRRAAGAKSNLPICFQASRRAADSPRRARPDNERTFGKKNLHGRNRCDHVFSLAVTGPVCLRGEPCGQHRLGLQHRSQDRGPNGCPRLALRNGGRCSSGGPNGPVRLRDTVDAVAARLKVHLGNGPASLVPQIEARARYRRVCLKDRRDERQIRPATSPPFAAFAMLTPSSTQIGLMYVCRSNADKAKLVRPESCRQ
jgi:hypothetical protein